jgi:hypothetical protein
MGKIQEIQYTLFIIYIRRKMRIFLQNNYENEKIRNLIQNVNIVINDNTPVKILQLEKRMLK